MSDSSNGVAARGIDLDDTIFTPSKPGGPFWHVQSEVLANVEARIVPWLWEPYIPIGMLTMLTGDPGVGKSFVALAIAAEITRQGQYVIYLTVENHKNFTLRPRFDALSGDATKLVLIEGATAGEAPEELLRRDITLADTAILEQAVEKYKPHLIVVDPIQSYLGASVDAHRSNETRPVLDGLIKLSEKYGLAVLLLRHASKAGGNRAIHRGLGSIDFTGAVRSELFAGETLEGQKALVHIKSNVGPLGQSQGYEISPGDGTKIYSAGFFRWTGTSNITCTELTASDDPEHRGKTDEAEDFLYAQLKDGPRSVKDLEREAKEAGIAWRTIQLAKEEIGFHAGKTGFNGGWEWPKLEPKRAKDAAHVRSWEFPPYKSYYYYYYLRRARRAQQRKRKGILRS